MSFYINDFKKHLQNLADNVDKPYDEPASHKSVGGSLEEAYVKMKQPSMGSFQRPAPTQLNEQLNEDSIGYRGYRIEKHFGYWIIVGPDGQRLPGEYKSKHDAAREVRRLLGLGDPNPGNPGVGQLRAMGRGNSSQFSNRMPIKRRPTLNNWGGGPGHGGGPGWGGNP